MRLRKFIFLYFILLIIDSGNYVQADVIDSLETLLATSKDKNQVHLLNELSVAYLNLVPAKTVEYGKQAYNLAVQASDEKEKLDAAENVGLGYYYSNDARQSFTWFNMAFRMYKETGNKLGVAKSYSRIGLIYYEWGLHEKALEYFLNGLKIFEEIKDVKQQSYTLNNLGLVYKEIEEYDKAYECHKSAMNSALEIGDKRLLAYSINNIGIVYKMKKDNKSAIEYFRKSLNLKTELGDKKGIANSLGNIGDTYMDVGDYTSALSYYNRANKIIEETGDKYNLAISYRNLGEAHTVLKNYPEAKNYLSKSLEIAFAEKLLEPLKNTYEAYSSYYFQNGDNQKALEYYKLYAGMKDSLTNSEKINKIAELQIVYNTEKTDRENELLRQNSEIQQIAISREQNLRYVLIVVIVLIFALVGVILNRYRIKNRINKLLIEKTSQIEQFNFELRNLNADLERRVMERTADLQSEINERSRADESMKEALKKAEEANSLKDAFLANVSHEIRTPLSSIIGLSEVLERKMPSDSDTEIRSYLDGIRQSSYRLLHLLNNIIDISRIEANDIKVLIESCNISEVVNNITQLYQFKANEKGLEITLDLQDTPPGLADINYLNKIITDVIDNAVKYTTAGTINISTGYYPEYSEVFIKVKDSGIGIEETYLPHVFESFRQESVGFTRSFQGAGLGLPLAKRLIKLMNGRIEISSKKNYGTIVTIFLPVFSRKDAGSQSISYSGVEIPDAVFLNKKIKVLIVEDDLFNALFLNAIFDNIGVTTQASNGQEAIQIVEEMDRQGNVFDVMLVDINLPGKWNGIELMKEIKKRFSAYNNIMFIAQTAYAMSEMKEKTVEAGFNEYITKPINTSILLNIIKNHFV